MEFLAPNISSLFATMYMQIADDFVIFGTQGAACACATYPETFSWLTNTSRLVKRHFAHHSLSLQTKYSKFNICNFAHSFLPQSAVYCSPFGFIRNVDSDLLPLNLYFRTQVSLGSVLWVPVFLSMSLTFLKLY